MVLTGMERRGFLHVGECYGYPRLGRAIHPLLCESDGDWSELSRLLDCVGRLSRMIWGGGTC